MSYYRIGAEENPPLQNKSGSSMATVGILAAITLVIFGTAPGTRHYLRHGRFPR